MDKKTEKRPFKVDDWVVKIVDTGGVCPIDTLLQVTDPCNQWEQVSLRGGYSVSKDCLRHATNAEIAKKVLEEETNPLYKNPNTKGDTTMYTYIAYRERKVQKETEEGEKYWKTVRDVLTPNPRVVDASNETDAQIAAALQLQEELPKVERDEIKVIVSPFGL